MTDYGRGAKAGVVAGIPYGIISGILYFLVIQAMAPGYWTSMAAANVSMMIKASMIVMSIISGIIGGLIFGVIYAAVYDPLPGDSSVVKGIILSLLFWLILGVGLGYSGISQISQVAGTGAAGAYLAVGLVSSLIWGALVGKLWDSFG